MNIYICIKQVPDTETRIQLSEDQKLQTSNIKWIINPYDEYAIEEALLLKAKKENSTVTAIALGPKTRVIEALRTALAMGADAATLIDAPETLDANATAKALANCIQHKPEPSIIYTGKLAIDDNGFAVTQMLAEYLNFSHVTNATKIEYLTDKVSVQREIEGGCQEVIEVTYPTVIGVNKGINTPRYATLPGIMKAKKKTIEELSAEATNEDIKVELTNYQLPPERPPVKMIEGDPNKQAADLAKLLREESKVI